MFSNFFSRKSAPAPAEVAESPVRNVVQLRTPSPSVDSASAAGKANTSSPPPQITPSPPPPEDLAVISDPSILHILISSVPPKILHEYTLAHLLRPSSEPILTHLTSFFSSLSPPPRLHCARCHKFYFDVDNADRSCLVPHDDDSAEVERVGVTKGTAGTEYETLWGCCGRTVEGDGDMGPPDGWCYEGRHTTDTKRARFRADSTIHDDKLSSCDRLKCFHSNNPPSPTAPHQDLSESEATTATATTTTSSPRRRGGGTRKRARPADDEQEHGDGHGEETDSRTVGSSSNKPKSAAPRRKRARKSAAEREAHAAFKPKPFEEEEEEGDTDVDMDMPSSTSPKRRKAEKKASSFKKSGSPGKAVSFAAPEEEPSSIRAAMKMKKRRKGIPLEEVVATSVDGEEAWVPSW